MRKGVNRLYNDLSWLWPFWGDVEEYRRESELFARLIKQYAHIEVRSLLDMGCGGGKNAFHLKKHFEVTGIDISEPMLSLAKKLNPECTFLIEDMRKFNLNRQFDSVFINDSVTYMITKEELLNAFQSAYMHLRAGGVMITYPDHCKDTFHQNKTEVSSSKTDTMVITFIENNYDSIPDDDTYETTFIFLIRENGELRIEHDFHVCGLFTLDVWRELLRKAGFEVHEESWGEGVESLPVFACVKETL